MVVAGGGRLAWGEAWWWKDVESCGGRFQTGGCGRLVVCSPVASCGWVNGCSRWVLAYSWLVTGRSQGNCDEFF